MKIIAITLLIISLFIILMAIRHRYVKTNKIDAFIVISSFYGLIYSAVPLMYLLLPKNNYTTIYMNSIQYSPSENYAFFSILIMIFYLFFWLVNRNVPLITIETDKNSKNAMSNKIFSSILIVGISTFFVGALSISVIILEVGGLDNFLRLSSIRRGFDNSAGEVIDSNLLFFVTLMPSILASTYLLFVAKKYHKSHFIKFLYYFALIISIIFLISNGGRAPLILFLIPFILYKVRSKVQLFLFFCASFLIIPLLNFLDRFFYRLNYGAEYNSDMQIWYYFVQQFGYPFANMMNYQELLDYIGYRYGLDFITWIINITPTFILDILGLEKVDNLNSMVTLAYGDIMFAEMGGGIPLDIVTLSLIQFSFIGIIILSLSMGLLIRVIDKIYYNLSYYNIYFRMIFLRVVLLIAFLIPNSNLDAFVRNRFDILILIVHSLFCYFILSKKKNNNNYQKG